jgi:hypothetical protein
VDDDEAGKAWMMSCMVGVAQAQWEPQHVQVHDNEVWKAQTIIGDVKVV